MKIQKSPADQQGEMDIVQDVSRRRFLQMAGGIAGAGVLLSATAAKGESDKTAGGKQLGTGDTALLNFIYVLQQIEAEFYSKAVAGLAGSIDRKELVALTEVRDQEAKHVQVLRSMLGKKAIDNVSTDFSSVSFSNHESVLTHAAAIENIALCGINSAAPLFKKPGYALNLSSIAIGDSRHSSFFGFRLGNTFGGNEFNPDDLGQAIAPAAVLAKAEAYTNTRFDGNNLPNHTNSKA